MGSNKYFDPQTTESAKRCHYMKLVTKRLPIKVMGIYKICNFFFPSSY